MTFDYEIYPESRMIVTRYGGHFTFADLKAFTEKLWSDPRYSRSYDGLVDLTDAQLGVAQSDLLALISFVREHEKTSEGRWAAITQSPLATACGLFYQKTMASRHTFDVFTTREGAEWFLGIDFGEGPILGKGSAPRRTPHRP